MVCWWMQYVVHTSYGDGTDQWCLAAPSGCFVWHAWARRELHEVAAVIICVVMFYAATQLHGTAEALW
jgi:hypothetical protein